MRITNYILCMCLSFFGCQQNKPEKAIKAEDTAMKNDPVYRQEKAVKTIVFFGNSLTAGYGLSIEESFPSLIQQKIDSLKLAYKTVNAGLSGETSAGGLSRIDWILKQQIDVFVLELGANDGLRGLGLKETKENLQKILSKVKAKYPDVRLVIAGMQLPPSMGKEYASKFKELFSDLARENNALLIPFLLDKVAGEALLNQQDGIHPSVEGAKIVAENVWAVLQKAI